jgi:hypothetical protein
MRDNEIVAECIPILRDVGRHRNYSRRFISAYQLWGILSKRKLQICAAIEQEYGKALGHMGGAPTGPAQRIAQALSRSRVIETQYLDTRQIWFRRPTTGDSYKASGPDCGIFRYVGKEKIKKLC